MNTAALTAAARAALAYVEKQDEAHKLVHPFADELMPLRAALALNPGPSVPLSEVARIVRESAPAESRLNSTQSDERRWAFGVNDACERIANAIADLSDLRPSERAEFCRAAGVSDLKG